MRAKRQRTGTYFCVCLCLKLHLDVQLPELARPAQSAMLCNREGARDSVSSCWCSRGCLCELVQRERGGSWGREFICIDITLKHLSEHRNIKSKKMKRKPSFRFERSKGLEAIAPQLLMYGPTSYRSACSLLDYINSAAERNKGPEAIAPRSVRVDESALARDCAESALPGTADAAC